MSTGTLPTDLPRSLLIRRTRREVDATVTDYMRLGDWDEQLAVSVVERMLHHKDAHGVLCSHWAVLIEVQQPGTSSSGSSMQAQPRGLASQAAEVARRMLLRLLPSRPELFTSSVCTLLLGVLHYLMHICNVSDVNNSDGSGRESSLQQLQHFSGSQQQYEDTVECALQVLEGPTEQHQQLPQQPQLLAPTPAMLLLAGLCNSQHDPLVRVLRSARCTALTMRCLFDPRITHTSRYVANVLICNASDVNNSDGSGGESSLQQLQHFSGSQQQYEDTVECAVRVLEGPTGQQQQQPQQPELLAPAPAMQLLAGLCNSQHDPLLRVLRSARCKALAVRCLFDPRIIQASVGAAAVLDALLQHEVPQGNAPWACDPILFGSTIGDALGHAEACMVWQAAYGTSAFVQAAHVPWNGDTAHQHFTALKAEVYGCTVLFYAMRELPLAAAAGLLMRRPCLLHALCTLCDSAALHVAACGASSRAHVGLWFDELGYQVVNTLAKYMCLISASPHPSSAHVRAMELGLRCLLRMCERAPRLKVTTMSAVLLSFKAWCAILEFCDEFTGGQEQACGAVLSRHRAKAALAVFGRTHALGRLLEAAVSTERWLEGRPGGIADVNSRFPCYVVDALLEAALLLAHSVLLVSAALDDDGIGSMTGLQQQRLQHLADVLRIHDALLAACESFGGAGRSAAVLRVPVQVQELVRDLQRAIDALAPHGI